MKNRIDQFFKTVLMLKASEFIGAAKMVLSNRGAQSNEDLVMHLVTTFTHEPYLFFELNRERVESLLAEMETTAYEKNEALPAELVIEALKKILREWSAK